MAATEGVTIDTAKEVVRLSELYVDGTLKLSVAADTRAMQISGMMAAASIALLGFGANLVSHLDRIDKSIGTAALTAGALFCWRCFSP